MTRGLRAVRAGTMCCAIWRTVIVLASLGAGTAPTWAATLPFGFVQAQVGSRLVGATSMTFAPDGRLFVSEELGTLRIIKDGVLLPTPFLTVVADNTNERGLLGIAFDPDFANTRFVYIYYTAKTPAIHNRLSRFTASATDPDVADSDSEVVLLEIDDSLAGFHNGGSLNFGLDGKLYISVGDDATPANAQTLANLRGKLLRINRDGTIPDDNPFNSTASGRNRAIWALGFRNPFTVAVQPDSGRIFINDVGSFRVEEINDVVVGGNYGWPRYEGYSNEPGYIAPIYAYDHGDTQTTGCAIIGGAFYEPTTNVYPPGYLHKYFFGDHCNGWIQTLDPLTYAVAPFATGVDRVVDFDLGPDGNIYYLSRGTPNLVYKIAYTEILAPQIGSEPEDVTVSEGQSASFFVDASGEPPLEYQWLRDDQEIAGAVSSSYTLPSAALTDSGAEFRCRISNFYGSATSAPAILTVTSNQPPVGVITTPMEGHLYSAGDRIDYAGSGTDPEDGEDLPASAFTWHADFHHDEHTHPFLPPTRGSKSGSFVIPVIGETAANVWYRLYLTVTDSEGGSHTSHRDLIPRTVTMTFASSPPNLPITLDGQPLTTPSSIEGVVGIRRTLGVVSPQIVNGVLYDFVSWSDQGTESHDIATPPSDTTYTATYRQASSTDLIVTGTDSPDPLQLGGDLTYAFKARNRGPATASAVVLTDTLPAGVAVISTTSTKGACSLSGNKLTCAIGTLLKAEYVLVTIVMHPIAAGTLINDVTVTATEPDPDPANNSLRRISRVVTLRSLTYRTPSALPGGCQDGTGKVGLTDRAPAGGLEVALTNTNPAASVPARVLVPAGTFGATFPIRTTAVSATQAGEIRATVGSVSVNKALYVRRIGPRSVTISPNPTVGPSSATGTVRLECGASPRDISVTLSSSDPAVVTPGVSSLVIPAGSTSRTFPVTVAEVSTPRGVTITATANLRTATTLLTVENVIALHSLTYLTPSALPGGCPDGLGKVTLTDPARAGGIVVALGTTNPAVSVPSTVTVAEGARTATFPIHTVPVTATQVGVVSATLGSTQLTKAVQVRRIGVLAVAVRPNPATGPSSATGSVTLDCPAAPGDITVSLSSSQPAVASPATATIRIPVGSASGAFAVQVAAVSSPRTATISGTAHNRTAATLVTVRP